MMRDFDPMDGAILIDKPAGPTSHDVVDALRRAFRLEKAGHCGTLDPNATGLLIIVLGKGTKLSEKLMSDDKVYEGTIKFGETTDSFDADGELVSSLPVPPMTRARRPFRATKCKRRPWFPPSKSKAFRFTRWRAKASRSNARRA
jgi:tRNA pseudouridine55 synthase